MRAANGYTATGTLTGLALRRDRVRLPIWLLGLAGLIAGTAAGIADLYQSDIDQLENARIRASSVVARAFTGPAPGSSTGALAMSEALVFTCMLAALLNILIVVRHTRQNEELGRTELTRSAVVGRHAGLTAALLVAAGTDLALAALCALGLISTGLPVTGALLAGAAVGAVGLVFAGIAAITAQIAEGARGAIGLASIALGVAYLLRAAGDSFGDTDPSGLTVTPAWPSWLSPLGWGQRLEPFGDNHAWPLALFAVFFVVAVAVAGSLATHRDIGTGMLPVRRGAERAGAALRGPFGLVFRLQRGVLLGWLAGMAVSGAALGGLGDQVTEIFNSEGSAELLRQLGGGDSLVDAYFAAMMSLFAVLIAGYPIQALLRLRADETAGGAVESVLATAVSRPRWLAAHAVCAVAGAALVLAALGFTTGAAYGLVSGDLAGALGDLMTTTLAQLPPTMVLAGFVLAAFGLLPRYAVALSWAAFGVCLVVGQFGTLLGLPQAMLDVSPFTHVPALPAAQLTATPLLIMTAVALVLGTAGTIAFRRRNLVL